MVCSAARNVIFRFVLTGALAVGAAIAGLVGELTPVRTTLWLGAALLAAAFLPVFCSPLRTRRELPGQQAAPAAGTTPKPARCGTVQT